MEDRLKLEPEPVDTGKMHGPFLPGMEPNNPEDPVENDYVPPKHHLPEERPKDARRAFGFGY